MADGNNYAPDFPDAPRPSRPVPKRVERAAAGALKQQIGAGRAWSAFETGAAKQAHMAAYAQVGAEAAQNIRQRFYKKEWDQVKQLKIDPLIAQMQKAKAQYEYRTRRAIVPVPRTVTQEEGQARAMMSPQPMETKVPGGEGQKDKTEVQMVPGQNLAEAPGQYGGTEIQDLMSIMDPATGQPVDFHSEMGQSINRRAVDDFWGAYGAISTQIMDVVSEYSGNPFADYAAGTMIEQVMKQAGQGVTGKSTPEEQELAWRERQKFDAGMEQHRAEMSKAALAEEQAIGERAGEVQAALALARTDERFAGYLKKSTLKKMEAGKQLTPQEDWEVIAAEKAYVQRQRADMVMAAEQGRTRLPQVILAEPTQWGGHLRMNDEGYANIFDDLSQEVVVTSYQDMMADPEAFIAADPNMPGEVRRHINAANFDDPRVTDYLKQTAVSPELQADFHATATALRMSELAQQDPRVQDEIDRRVAETRAQWVSETGSVPESVDLMLATHPEAFFVGASTGANATLRKPPGWEGAVQRYKATQRAKQGLPTLRPAPPEVAPVPYDEKLLTVEQLEGMKGRMQPLTAPRATERYNLRDLMEVGDEQLNLVPQHQLAAALKQVNRLLLPEEAIRMSTDDLRSLQALQQSLARAHKGPIESFLKGQAQTIGGGLKDLFTTSDEEKQRAEQKRQALWIVE